MGLVCDGVYALEGNILPMRATILTTLLLAFGLNASASMIFLSPSTTTPQVGSTFTIDVMASTTGLDSIVGFGFDYSVSTSAILYQGYTIGPLFTDLLLGNPAVSAISNSFTGESGPSITLATFTFLANSLGNSVFSVFGNSLDSPDLGLFLLTGEAAEFAVLDINSQASIDAVPEPATFGLCGLALAGVVVVVRRRSTTEPNQTH